MTPLTKERILRQSLKAIVEGEGELDARIDGVVNLLKSKLSPTDSRSLAKALKGRLQRALRSKQALVSSKNTLPTDVAGQLDGLARSRGAQLVEFSQDPSLLAGFQMQLGDDRHDLSLLKRLQQL